MRQKGLRNSFLGANRDQQDKIVTVFLWVLGLGTLVYLIYLVSLAPSPRPPAKIYADAYDGPPGCPNEVGTKFEPDEVEGCFSPKNLIADHHEKGLTFHGARGGLNLNRYYRVENDAILIQCGKGFDVKIHCRIHWIERDIFVVKGRGK